MSFECGINNIEYEIENNYNHSFISLGLIIAAIPENTTSPFKLTAGELLDEVKSETQFVHPDQVANMIVQKDPTLQLIDIRSKEEYENIPYLELSIFL